MANFGYPTWPSKFSPAIAQRLVDLVPLLNRDRVFTSAFTEEIHLEFPPSDKFVTLFMPDFSVDAPGVSGGGELTTGFDATLETKAYIRLEADIEARSTRLLEETAFGVYEFVQQIITALQMYQGPVDAGTGLSLFKRPMRLRPGFRIQPKGGTKASRWAVAPITWEVAFSADLGNNYGPL